MFKKILEIKKIFRGGRKVASQTQGTINCLQYRDGDIFIAHCLEFDLVAEGSTQEEARTNLADLIKTHIQFAIEKDVEDKALFHPAPSKYWEILHHVQTKIARKMFLDRRDISTKSILENMHCTYAHI